MIKKINEQTSRDTSNYLNNKLDHGGELSSKAKAFLDAIQISDSSIKNFNNITASPGSLREQHNLWIWNI